jgi:hypothetical protein
MPSRRPERVAAPELAAPAGARAAPAARAVGSAAGVAVSAAGAARPPPLGLALAAPLPPVVYRSIRLSDNTISSAPLLIELHVAPAL